MYFKNKLLKKRNGNNFKRAKLNFDKHSLTINVLLVKRIIFERKFYLNTKNIKRLNEIKVAIANTIPGILFSIRMSPRNLAIHCKCKFFFKF